MYVSRSTPRGVRDAFWLQWQNAQRDYRGILAAAECGWPVEVNFLEACIKDDANGRTWEGPYPLHEIASFMLLAGMDPMATYERQSSELPVHNPLADARLSARLLEQALWALRERA